MKKIEKMNNNELQNLLYENIIQSIKITEYLKNWYILLPEKKDKIQNIRENLLESQKIMLEILK